jgi:hypothetical protein
MPLNCMISGVEVDMNLPRKNAHCALLAEGTLFRHFGKLLRHLLRVRDVKLVSMSIAQSRSPRMFIALLAPQNRLAADDARV